MSKFQDLAVKMTDVEANQGSNPLPKSRYTFLVERYDESETGENSKVGGGELMYKVGLSVQSNDQYNGKWVFDYITMAGPRLNDNMGRLRGLLEACGTSEDDMAAPSFDPNTEWGQENVVGRVVEGDVYVTKASENFSAGNGVEAYYQHEFTDADLI